MYCKSCGANISDGHAFCPKCGTSLKKEPVPVTKSQPEQSRMQSDSFYQQPVNRSVQMPAQTAPVVNVNVPDNTPSVGSFMGWMFIPVIPIIGFILIIVFACDSSNKTRQNFFKANLIWMLIAIGIGVVVALIVALSGGALMYGLY